MCTVCNNDPDVKGHVLIVTLYAVIMFKGHVSFYSEWTSLSHHHYKNRNMSTINETISVKVQYYSLMHSKKLGHKMRQ